MKLKHIVENDLDMGSSTELAEQPISDVDVAKIANKNPNQDDQQFQDALEISDQQRDEIEKQTVDKIRPGIKGVDTSFANLVKTYDTEQTRQNMAMDRGQRQYQTAAGRLQQQLDKI